jgi:serine/threonine-protein kinase HipA
MNDLIVDIKLWGRVMGYLTWDKESSAAIFEYDPSFRRSNWQVAPIIMPLSKSTEPYQFLENRTKCFKGLPGLVADALPDSFGNEIINEWFYSRGLSLNEITPLDRLCYVGKRAMGALEFEPSRHISGINESSIIHIDELTQLANSIFEERKIFQAKIRQGNKAILDILKVGTSAGGAKPKAIISLNDQTGEVRSGQVAAPEGFRYWLLKFDGGKFTEHSKINENPKGIGNIEYAYHKMAIDCGITMTECRLLQENDSSHFMTERFDRLNSEKIHTQTLAGLAHLDRDTRHSYEEIFQIMRRMNFGYESQEQLYRRMVFNVIARNHDDHTKNFSFLMDKHGEWSFAPAYDLCYSYSPDGRWTNKHQMAINGKQDGFTYNDLTSVAEKMGIRNYKPILEEIIDTVSMWRKYATESGVRKEHAKFINENLLLLNPENKVFIPNIDSKVKEALLKN